MPAEYGVHVWKAVLEAGEPLGIRPFGVEAQRMLRLEKKQVIVGVDTDSLSNPYESDMPWVAKLDKPDFIGKTSLEGLRSAPANERLIGFVMLDDRLPDDGREIDVRGQGQLAKARVHQAAFYDPEGTRLRM